MTFVLLVLAAWLVLNAGVFGTAAVLGGLRRLPASPRPRLTAVPALRARHEA